MVHRYTADHFTLDMSKNYKLAQWYSVYNVGCAIDSLESYFGILFQAQQISKILLYILPHSLFKLFHHLINRSKICVVLKFIKLIVGGKNVS